MDYEGNVEGNFSIGFGVQRKLNFEIVNNLNATGYKDNLISPVLANGRYVDMV